MKPFLMLALSTFAAVGVEVDLVIDWQGINRGLITNYNEVNAGTRGASGSWYGYGSGEVTPYQRMYVEARTNAMTFPVSVTLSNAAVTGDGTNWVRADWALDGYPEYMALELPGGYSSPAQTNVMVGGFVKFDWAADYVSIDLIWLFSPNSRSGVMNSYGTSGKYLRAHGIRDNGTSSYSDQAPFFELIQIQNKTYYFTLNMREYGTNVVLRLYDPDDNYNQVGIAHSEVGDGQPYTMVLPTAYPNGVSPGRSVYWGPMFGIFDPTAEEIASLVPSLSFEVVSNQVATALSGDTITLPASTATWTNTLWITKPLALNWSGAALTNCFSAAGNETPLIGVSSPGVVISNLNIYGQNNTLGCGIATYTNNVRIAHSSFNNLRVGLWFYVTPSNVVDHCSFTTNRTNGRHKGTPSASGDTLWANYYPIPWDSLHPVTWENSAFTNHTLLCLESGAAGAYIMRHCTNVYSTLASYQAFDAHGDDLDTRGTMIVQVYSNQFIYLNGAYSSSLGQFRGGVFAFYGNTASGYTPGIEALEECDIWGFPAGRDAVTNSYCWANVNMNAAGIKADSSTNYLAYNVNVYNSAPAELLSPPYPHPLVSGASSPAEPEPGPTGSVIVRGQGVKVRGPGVIIRGSSS